MIKEFVLNLKKLLKGSLVSTTLAYVLPGLCTIVINCKRGENYIESFRAILIFLIGIVIFIFGVISIIHKIQYGYDCSHGKEMSYCIISVSNHSSPTTNY
jgi:ACR3 family arsenite efflux pump ArsB